MSSSDPNSRAYLARVLIARVALGALSLAIVLGLDWASGGLPEGARQGLYLTVALGFASILASALWLRGMGRTDFFTLSQIGLDVAMVTSLVHFSGDPDSVFTFLYLIVTIYAAMLHRRQGAMVSAGLSSLSYGALIVAAHAGWVASYGADFARAPLSVLAAAWSVRVSAVFLVAVLAMAVVFLPLLLFLPLLIFY